MRRIETALAVAAGLAGLAALGLDLVLPTYRFQGQDPSGSVQGSASLLQFGLTPGTAIFMAAVGAVCIVLPTAAVADARTGRRWTLGAVWASALFLLVASGVSALSIGPTLLPAVALGLVTAVCASLARR